MDNKPYLKYDRKEINEEKMENHRKEFYEKGGKRYSGEIIGEFEILTPMYTEGFKRKSVENNFKIKNENELSLSTTFKSQIRITAEYLNIESATRIFGDLIESSKVEFILLDIIKPLRASFNLKIPRLFSPKGDKMRFYYNQLNRIDDKKAPEIILRDFEKSLNLKGQITTLEGVYLPKTKVSFKIKYRKLSSKEIIILTKALVLKDGLYHQIGSGKSYGMGTINVKVNKILINDEERYKSLFSNKISGNITKNVMENIEKSKNDFNDPVFETYKANNDKINLDNVYNQPGKR